MVVVELSPARDLRRFNFLRVLVRYESGDGGRRTSGNRQGGKGEQRTHDASLHSRAFPAEAAESRRQAGYPAETRGAGGTNYRYFMEDVALLNIYIRALKSSWSCVGGC